MRAMRIIGGLVLALTVLCGCTQTQTIETEVETGYKGKARFDHYMAAAETLDALGLSAESSRQLGVIPYTDTFLLLPASFVESRGIADEMAEWIEDGGHLALVFYEPPLSMEWFRFDSMEASNGPFAPNEFDELKTPLLDRYSLSYHIAEQTNTMAVVRSNTIVQIKGESLRVSLPDHSWFEFDGLIQSGTIRSGQGSDTAFLSMPINHGRISLINDARLFCNRYIQHQDHARFLWQLANLERPNDAHIVYGVKLSFFGMLLRYGWIPLLALALLVLVWLARNLPRFGPEMPAPEAGNREFSEHISTTGQFLWHHGSADSLIAPLRRNIQRKVQHGALIKKTEAPLELIAERSNIPLHRVEAAMNEQVVVDPSTMTRIIRDLQLIDQSL